MSNNNNRPETGAMQFGEDWPGIFIRGDNALGHAQALMVILSHLDGEQYPTILYKSYIQELIKLLQSCVPYEENFEAQMLKSFDECLKKKSNNEY